MTCPHCRGELRKGSAPFHVDRAGCHVHWDAVPAWVCNQCGEAVFEGEQVDAIRETLSALDAGARRFARAG